MEIIRAEKLGFCMGVSKAVNIAFSMADSKEPIYIYGKLIHNNSVLEKLEKSGIKTVDENSIPENGTIIIRAHGVPLNIKEKFIEKGLKVIDATCPKVLHSQKIATEATQNNKRVIIVGEKNHSELLAIASCCFDPIIISTKEEANSLKIEGNFVTISQTTIKKDEYLEICEIIKKNNQNINLQIKDTICLATLDRQNALKKLIEKCDSILVVGGKESANTHRLFQTAIESGKPSWHIENSNEIPREIYNYDKVGLTAGASTPDWVVDEIVAKIIKKI